MEVLSWKSPRAGSQEIIFKIDKSRKQQNLLSKAIKNIESCWFCGIGLVREGWKPFYTCSISKSWRCVNFIYTNYIFIYIELKRIHVHYDSL